MAVVDDLLSPAALKIAYDYAMRSTVWWHTKTSYLGTYTGNFAGVQGEFATNELLPALVDALRRALPRVLCSHRLKWTWMYKYDSDMDSGINLHADQAAVNLNLWITPTEAVKDSAEAEAGLIVYTIKPPASWGMDEHSRGGAEGEKRRRKLLLDGGFRNVTVPYRQNRLVLFDSTLFHRSGRVGFKKGYRNRRVNWTLLFGNRGEKCVLPTSPMGAESSS